MTSPVSAVAKRAADDLAAWRQAQGTPGFPVVKDTDKQFALTNALLDIDADANCLSRLDGNSNPTQVRFLAALLVRHWDVTVGYAYPSQDWLMRKSGWSASTLLKVISALRATGLFGVLSGYRTPTASVASRYYPLFHGPSRRAFSEHLDAREQKARVALSRKASRMATSPTSNDSGQGERPGFELEALSASRARGHKWELPATAHAYMVEPTLELLEEGIFRQASDRLTSFKSIKAVALAICQLGGASGGVALTRGQISAHTGLSETTIKRAISSLQRVGLLGTVKTVGRGNANTYYLLVHKTTILAFTGAVFPDVSLIDNEPPPF